MDAKKANAESRKPEKRTRRRLRVSCIECTKRRQKCDRNVPCSLCVSRGVAHLCRWSSVPVARPSPARPPSAALLVKNSSNGQDLVIEELRERVASLENELAQRALQDLLSTRTLLQFDLPQSGFSYTDSDGPSMKISSVSSTPSPYQLPKPLSEVHLSLEDGIVDISHGVYMDDPLKEAAAAVSRLAIGHYGEYIGRGCLIFAMLSSVLQISSKDIPRFLYAKSTDPTAGKRENTSMMSVLPPLCSIQSLLEMLPPTSVVTSLTETFFSEVNWDYGVPEEWFRSTCSHMWAMLQYPDQYNSEVNANWLMLLFAVLASSQCHIEQKMSRDPAIRNSDGYFMCAMMARRVAEDDYLKKPGPSSSLLNSAADGTVLACFAISILGCHLARRGRMSEAWKLIGNGVRGALAVGMHRDPEWPYWQVMSEDEKLLRKRAWWGLFVWDRLYSYVLGRPPLIRSEHHDVKLPLLLNADGSRNMYNEALNAMVGLASLVAEAMDNCFSIHCPDIPTFLRMDDRLIAWEAQLSSEYGHSSSPKRFQGLTPEEASTLARQRYKLHAWYLIVRLKILTTCSLLAKSSQMTASSRESIGRSIAISLEIMQFHCDVFVPVASGFRIVGPGMDYAPGDDWCGGCLSLLEASVSLMITLAKHPLLDKVTIAEEMLDRTVSALAELSRDARIAELAEVGIEMLRCLREQSWWKALAQKHANSGPNQHVEQWDTSNLYYPPQSLSLTTTMQVDDMHPYLSGSRSHQQSSQVAVSDGWDDATRETPDFPLVNQGTQEASERTTGMID